MKRVVYGELNEPQKAYYTIDGKARAALEEENLKDIPEMYNLVDNHKYQKEIVLKTHEVRPKGEYQRAYANFVNKYKDFFHRMNLKNPEIQSVSTRSSISQELLSV